MDNQSEMKKYKFLPITLCIETLGGIATPFVLKGTALPTLRSQILSTAADNQKSVKIDIFLGESPIAARNIKIGTFELNGIEETKRGKPQIKITIEVDQNCKIKASAAEESSNITISEEFNTMQKYLGEVQIKKIIEESIANKQEDDKMKKAIEAKNRAESVIERAESVLKEKQKIGHTFTEEYRKIEKAIADLGIAIDSDDIEPIQLNVESLEALIPLNSFDFNFGGANDIFSTFFGTSKANVSDKNTSTSSLKNNNKKKPKMNMTTTNLKSEQIGKIFGGGEFTIDTNLCFVIMPFNDAMKPIYDDHIKKVIKKEGLTCIRADEIVGVNSITKDIWEQENRARLLIADLTTKNPNVFYELGLAHALGKDVVLLAQSIEDVPFDLKSLRCIIYSYTPRGIKEMEEKLSATVKNILDQT